MEKERIPWGMVFCVIMMFICLVLMMWALGRYIETEQTVGNLPSVNQTIMNNISQTARHVFGAEVPRDSKKIITKTLFNYQKLST